MKTLILGATIASLLTGSSLAALLIQPGDPVLGVQLQEFGGISVATEGFTEGVTEGQNFTPNSGEENAEFSIDRAIGTKYLNFGANSTGILVDAADDLSMVTGLLLITANDAPQRDPASFSIYGTNVTQSTNFSDYTLIIADQPILGVDPGRSSSSELVSFTNPTGAAFDSYLVVFPLVRGGFNEEGESPSMQVAEIVLDGTPVPEPTVALSLVSGLGLLGFLRRRRSA